MSSDLLHTAAIIKHHGGTMDILHIWSDNDRPRQNLERQIIVQHRHLIEESDKEAEQGRD